MTDKIRLRAIALFLLLFIGALPFNSVSARTVGKFKGQQKGKNADLITYDEDGNITSYTSVQDAGGTLNWFWVYGTGTAPSNGHQECVNTDGEWDTTDYDGNPSPFGP